MRIPQFNANDNNIASKIDITHIYVYTHIHPPYNKTNYTLNSIINAPISFDNGSVKN